MIPFCMARNWYLPKSLDWLPKTGHWEETTVPLGAPPGGLPAEGDD